MRGNVDMPLPDITGRGRLVRTPEFIGTGANGRLAAAFTVAFNSTTTTAAGDRIEGDRHFQRFLAYGPLAEQVVADMRQGDELVIKGHLRTVNFEGTDGARRSRYEAVADWIGESLLNGYRPEHQEE